MVRRFELQAQKATIVNSGITSANRLFRFGNERAQGSERCGAERS
jgi:hypothetical protein